MRALFFALGVGLAGVLCPQKADSAPLPDIPTDKAAHFGVSVVLVESAMRLSSLSLNDPKVTTVNRVWSSTLTLGIGLVKELYDQRLGHGFSYGDLAADGLGVITGNLLYCEF